MLSEVLGVASAALFYEPSSATLGHTSSAKCCWSGLTGTLAGSESGKLHVGLCSERSLEASATRLIILSGFPTELVCSFVPPRKRCCSTL